jgi:uncharacterized protein YbaR (Trm112 family)
MIEIIEKRDNHKFEVVCPECDSKLRYSRNDAICEFDKMSGEDYIRSLVCPNCGCNFEFEV